MKEEDPFNGMMSPREMPTNLLKNLLHNQRMVFKTEPIEAVKQEQDMESRDSDSPSSVMKFFPFGLDQNMVCPMCKKCFRFEKNLLRHMQNSHATGTGESILKCKLCNYTTRHYSNMYVHIRTHTGDKPYSCSACGAAFTQGSSLKLHIKSRHNDNTEYFSLTRKPGKNNLTKLWTRVLKKDLPKFNSNLLSAVMMSTLGGGMNQRVPAFQFKDEIKLPANQRVPRKYQSSGKRVSKKRDFIHPPTTSKCLSLAHQHPKGTTDQYNNLFNKFNFFTEAANIFINSNNTASQRNVVQPPQSDPGQFFNGYRVPSPTALLKKIRND